jgi:hypothetical protein
MARRRVPVVLRFRDRCHYRGLVMRRKCMQARSRQHEAKAGLPAEQRQHGNTGFHSA